MKICPNCKAQNDDVTNVCRYCGAALPVAPPPYQPQQQPYQPYQQAQTYQQPQPQPQYTQYAGGYQNAYDPRSVNLRDDISTARTLGIVSIVFLFIFTLVTLICSIIGINKANEAIQQAEALGDQMLINEAKDAKKLNKIALIIFLVFAGIGVLATILMAVLGIGLFSAGLANY